MVITDAIRNSIERRAWAEANKLEREECPDIFAEGLEFAKQHPELTKKEQMAYIPIRNQKLQTAKEEYVKTRRKELLDWAEAAPEPRVLPPIPPRPRRYLQNGVLYRHDVERYNNSILEHRAAARDRMPAHLANPSNGKDKWEQLQWYAAIGIPEDLIVVF